MTYTDHCRPVLIRQCTDTHHQIVDNGPPPPLGFGVNPALEAPFDPRPPQPDGPGLGGPSQQDDGEDGRVRREAEGDPVVLDIFSAVPRCHDKQVIKYKL